MNRWAIVEGWYWYCNDYHTGQFSKLYQRLCKIQQYYKPGLLARSGKWEDEEAREVYHRLVALKLQ